MGKITEGKCYRFCHKHCDIATSWTISKQLCYNKQVWRKPGIVWKRQERSDKQTWCIISSLLSYFYWIREPSI